MLSCIMTNDVSRCVNIASKRLSIARDRALMSRRVNIASCGRESFVRVPLGGAVVR